MRIVAWSRIGRPDYALPRCVFRIGCRVCKTFLTSLKTVARREFDSLGEILILAAGLAGGPKIENQVCGVSGCGKIRNMISNVWRGSDRCPD